jgi:hypothetical protein
LLPLRALLMLQSFKNTSQTSTWKIVEHFLIL